MEIKTKIINWDLSKLESFCTTKKTTNKVKRQPSEWEKIIARETTDRELISKIYNQLIQLNTKRKQTNKQTTLSKSGKGTWRDIYLKKTYRWLTSTWKDAQHHSLSEKCKSKLQWDTTSHQSEWPSPKNLQTINAAERVEKRERSWYSQYGRRYEGSLKS